jgi:hypothetical protein
MQEIAEGLISVEAGRRATAGRPVPLRQITVLAREAWEAAAAALGDPDLPWTVRRANLLVEGVELPRAGRHLARRRGAAGGDGADLPVQPHGGGPRGAAEGSGRGLARRSDLPGAAAHRSASARVEVLVRPPRWSRLPGSLRGDNYGGPARRTQKSRKPEAIVDAGISVIGAPLHPIGRGLGALSMSRRAHQADLGADAGGRSWTKETAGQNRRGAEARAAPQAVGEVRHLRHRRGRADHRRHRRLLVL